MWIVVLSRQQIEQDRADQPRWRHARNADPVAERNCPGPDSTSKGWSAARDTFRLCAWRHRPTSAPRWSNSRRSVEARARCAYPDR